VSGAGKSSVVYAYVFLILKTEGWRVVSVRSIRDSLLLLDDIFGGSRRRGTHLLIVFDQFEEFVILEDLASIEARRLFLVRLRELCQLQSPGVSILLSFRRDYMSDVIAMKIDDLIPGQIFMEIEAFRRGAARRFLEGAPSRPTTELVDRLLAGAEALDDVPARFRPVTLNMLGLALHDFDNEVTDRPDRLVQRHMQAAIAQPEIKEIAPLVIERMITGANTKQQLTISELVEQTGLESQDIIACLVVLARKGLVRLARGRVVALGNQSRFCCPPIRPIAGPPAS
jgi:hypothetical protein